MLASAFVSLGECRKTHRPKSQDPKSQDRAGQVAARPRKTAFPLRCRRHVGLDALRAICSTLEIFVHCIKDSIAHSADMLALKAFAYIFSRARLKVARALAFAASMRWQLRCVASDLLNPLVQWVAGQSEQLELAQKAAFQSHSKPLDVGCHRATSGGRWRRPQDIVSRAPRLNTSTPSATCTSWAF